VRIALLGPLEVSEAGRRIRLAGTKQHALVAILALNASRWIPVDRLAPEGRVASASTSLPAERALSQPAAARDSAGEEAIFTLHMSRRSS
jgi:hypothetical protein